MKTKRAAVTYSIRHKTSTMEVCGKIETLTEFQVLHGQKIIVRYRDEADAREHLERLVGKAVRS